MESTDEKFHVDVPEPIPAPPKPPLESIEEFTILIGPTLDRPFSPDPLPIPDPPKPPRDVTVEFSIFRQPTLDMRPSPCPLPIPAEFDCPIAET
jgi:hypothetical protein